MKKINYLKGLRVFLAILIFIPILFYFIDFKSILPDSVHALLHLQLMPAILGGMIGILVFQFLLALLFGRIYCSTICPAGTLQDIINRIFCIGKTKKKGIRRFTYKKPQNILRYSILGLTAITMIFGFMGIALLLDPYSNFGRIASNLFRPVVVWVNNLTADQLMKMDNYSLYHVTIHTIKTSSLIAASVALLLFIVLTVWRGRLFCNTLCPVGALLSLISRYSFFRISFSHDSCNGCGSCERTCKAEAIDSKTMTVDTSRCVDCFNCISACPKGGLNFRFVSKKTSSDIIRKEMVNNEEKDAQLLQKRCTDFSDKKHSDLENESQTSVDRRKFLTTSALLASAFPIVDIVANRERKRKNKCDNCTCDSNKEKLPITPPGSLSLEHFKDNCTACQLCVVRCPSQVLRPTALQYGFNYMLKPEMSYDNSYCNYECTICSDVCPTGAIKPLTKEEKITTQIGIAHFHKHRCVVYELDQDCGACAEHCPTQAVHMIPYKGTLTIPSVNEDLCIGCGGCESICPVRPNRAITIEARSKHQRISPPKKEEVKDIEVDDFGF